MLKNQTLPTRKKPDKPCTSRKDTQGLCFRNACEMDENGLYRTSHHLNLHEDWDLKQFLALQLQFSCPVMSNSLRPHGLKHTRLPCPSPTPRAYSNSCPSSQWCHPAISSSVVPFSSCLQSFPASKSFPRTQFFTSDGQSTGASALSSVLPMNILDWFPLGLTGLTLLERSKGFQESSPTPQFKNINSLALSSLYSPTPTSIHDYWKSHSFD